MLLLETLKCLLCTCTCTLKCDNNYCFLMSIFFQDLPFSSNFQQFLASSLNIQLACTYERQFHYLVHCTFNYYYCEQICQDSDSPPPNINKTDQHLSCDVTGRPCCVGIQAVCMITTRENCEFLEGKFHQDAFLCSQVQYMYMYIVHTVQMYIQYRCTCTVRINKNFTLRSTIRFFKRLRNGKSQAKRVEYEFQFFGNTL